MQHRRQPVADQIHAEQIGEIQHPNQHRGGGQPVAEQPGDRVAGGDVQRLIGLIRLDVQPPQHRPGAGRQAAFLQQEPGRFRQPEQRDGQQRQRQQTADDEDRRPPVDRQQLRYQLAAEEPAQRCAGEHDHNHARAQAVGQVVGCQRHGDRHQGADAQACDEAQRREHRDRRHVHAGKGGHHQQDKAGDQHRFAAQAVADRAGGQRPHHDADAGHDEGAGKGRAGQVPGLRQRRRGHADAAEVIAVEGLRQHADRRDAKLQRADALAFQRGLGRGLADRGHDLFLPAAVLPGRCVDGKLRPPVVRASTRYGGRCGGHRTTVLKSGRCHPSAGKDWEPQMNAANGWTAPGVTHGVGHAAYLRLIINISE